MSDSEVEENFELIEYLNSANKLDYLTFFENNLRKWFLNDDLVNCLGNLKLDDTCEIKDNKFTLKCHFYPTLFDDEQDNPILDLKSIINDNLFSCQPFIYHPESSDKEGYNFSYNYEANRMHRWTGFPIILELNITQNVKKEEIILTGVQKKKENKEKVNQFIDSEILSQILESTKEILKNLKVCNIPLILTNGEENKDRFEGLVLFNFDESLDKEELDVDKHFTQAYLYSTTSIISPPAFANLEKIVDFYKGLSQRHFKGKEMQQYLGNKLYISGEFLYKINLPSDPKWNTTKVSYCQRSKPANQTKLNKEASKRASFGSFYNSNLQNSFYFKDSNNNQNETLLDLLWGPTCDPLRSFDVLTSFPQSEYSNDLELTPSIASHIHVYAQFRESKGEWLFLNRNLIDILNSWNDSDSNFMFSMESEETYQYRRNSNSPFNSSSPSIFNKESASKIVENILNSLFNENTFKCANPVNFRKSTNLNEILSTSYITFNSFSSKTVPYQSFLWKLMFNCLLAISSPDDHKKHDLNNILTTTWYEIVKLIRKHWENKQIIPNINTPSSNDNKFEVDLRFNLLHQKLSMLNYCINRNNIKSGSNTNINNNIRHSTINNPTTTTSSSPSNFRRLSKREPISDLSYNPSPPKGQFIKSSITSLHSYWNEKFQNDSKEDYIQVKESVEKASPLSISSSKSPKSLLSNALKASPELICSPNSYQKNAVGSLTNSLKNNSLNIVESHSSFNEEDNKKCVPINNKSTFNNRENSLNFDNSFVQLQCPSSISSYNSFSDIILPSTSSPKINTEMTNLKEEDENINNNEPQGRLKTLDNNCKLLEHDDLIYIPITQDPGVMSEDMLLDQAQLFERLGASEEGSKKRAQLQGAQLLSDMEAFKAANPKACLIDFIRWHSPRDWVVNDKKENGLKNENSNLHNPDGKEIDGRLSARMGNPDNLWQELWNKAKPVPAHLQKPLFDYNSEGEKALHFIENISIDELYHFLLPTIFLIAYDTLTNALPNEILTQITLLRKGLNFLGNEIMKFPWQQQELDFHEFDDILDQISDLELLFGRTISLINKIGYQFRLIELLLEPPNNSPVLIQGEMERDEIMNLFNSSKPSSNILPLARFEPALSSNTLNSNFPLPIKRELVIENRPLPSTSSDSNNLSQQVNWHRTYFSLESINMRITEMFSISNTE